MTTKVEKKKRKPATPINYVKVDEYGFRENSDSSIIVGIMLKGGLDRQDINEKVAQAISTETKSGRVKNIPSLISGLLIRLQKRGFTVEASWQLVAPKK